MQIAASIYRPKKTTGHRFWPSHSNPRRAYGDSQPRTGHSQGADPGHGRKPRSDRGATTIPDRALDIMAGMLMGTTRDNGKQLLTLDKTLKLAVANGILER